MTLLADTAVIGDWVTLGYDVTLDDGVTLVDYGSVLCQGRTLGYAWSAWRSAGDLWLQYGCETMPVAEWPDHLRALCADYEPERADEYERALSALIAAIPALLDSTEPGGAP